MNKGVLQVKITIAVFAAGLLFAMGELLWLRPDIPIGWIRKQPKPLATIYFLYFRIRGIEPDSAEGIFWFRLSGLLGVIASGVILLFYVGASLRL